MALVSGLHDRRGSLPQVSLLLWSRVACVQGGPANTCTVRTVRAVQRLPDVQSVTGLPVLQDKDQVYSLCCGPGNWDTIHRYGCVSCDRAARPAPAFAAEIIGERGFMEATVLDQYMCSLGCQSRDRDGGRWGR